MDFRRVVVGVAALGAFAAALLPAQAPEPSRWWSEVDRVDGFLLEGRWKTASRAGARLRTQVTELSWREPDLGQVLSELAFQEAVVHANRRNDDKALWQWYAAQALERMAGPARGGAPLLERDLARYGRAAEVLGDRPLRPRGEPPAGEVLRRGTLFFDYEEAVPPAHGVLPLRNVNVNRVAMPPVTFEIWVDTEGRPHQPIVTSTWVPPLMVQWGLDNLRVLPPFTPARYQGEAVGAIEELEFQLGETSRF